MSRYNDGDHQRLDETAAVERPWTAHRSSIRGADREQIENVEEQWIVVDGPGERALRLRQTEAIRDVLRWLATDRANQHNRRNEGSQPEP